MCLNSYNKLNSVITNIIQITIPVATLVIVTYTLNKINKLENKEINK